MYVEFEKELRRAEFLGAVLIAGCCALRPSFEARNLKYGEATFTARARLLLG